jgi:hypothetical protein
MEEEVGRMRDANMKLRKVMLTPAHSVHHPHEGATAHLHYMQPLQHQPHPCQTYPVVPLPLWLPHHCCNKQFPWPDPPHCTQDIEEVTNGISAMEVASSQAKCDFIAQCAELQKATE